jgi:transcriptional regulator with XRE-family HTH domain
MSFAADCVCQAEKRKLMFGEKLKRAREKTGLSQRQFALRGGIKVSTIWFYEKGLRDPQLGNIVLICQALGCTPNELIDIPAA